MSITNETLYLFVIVLGAILSVNGLMIIPLVRSKDQDLTDLAQAIFQGMIDYADKAVTPLGTALKPLHDGLVATESLVDEPDDWIIQQLARRLEVEPVVVVESLAALFRGGLQLTDGLPPEGELVSSRAAHRYPVPSTPTPPLKPEPETLPPHAAQEAIKSEGGNR
jgi:hypothetical protein